MLSRFDTCSYIADKKWRYAYFFAADLAKEELDLLLAAGWRKFGNYFFKPDCVDCYQCIPLRVNVKGFKPSKSQRRVLRKASQIEVRFKPLEYRDEIYEIYQDHSLNRFGRNTDKDEFLTSFYVKSCPAVQSEYYLGDELFAVGFLDVGALGISSVYFIFKNAYLGFRPGTFSCLREIEYAAENGYDYYYLGYYIQECRRMAYKNQFQPHEMYDWHSEKWVSPEDYSLNP